jgi:hypothetical protein
MKKFLTFQILLLATIHANGQDAAKRKLAHQVDSLRAIWAEEERIEDSIKSVEEAREVKAYRNAILKKYGKKNGTAILNGEVLLGMTKEMCRLAWGDQCIVNKRTTAGLVVERWTYSSTQYLVFKNGVVTMINE